MRRVAACGHVVCKPDDDVDKPHDVGGFDISGTPECRERRFAIASAPDKC